MTGRRCGCTSTERRSLRRRIRGRSRRRRTRCRSAATRSTASTSAGLIDEVRVYNVALTAAQIQTDQTTPITPTGPDTTPPSAPASLTATAINGGEIDLSWPAATDNVGVTGYQVERCQGASCSTFAQIATPSATSYKDTGVTAGNTYNYRVRATDAAGNLGNYSPTANATTPAPDTTPPSAPASLTATAINGGEIDLSWPAATDNVGVTGYQVERCQGASCSTFAQIATPSATSYKDTGVTAGNTYNYRVRATDAAGNLGNYSPTANATTPAPDTTPPSAPASLTATAINGGEIDLSWPAATDNVGVTGYQVERCQGASCSTFAQIATPSATSYKDTGVTAGNDLQLPRPRHRRRRQPRQLLTHRQRDHPLDAAPVRAGGGVCV